MQANMNFKTNNFIDDLLKTLASFNDVISVTNVGSFNKTNIEEISDVDLIVIINELNKDVYDNILNAVNNFNISNYYPDYKIWINSTFGPLKFHKDKTLVIHLMIYSLNHHIKHTVESPFTTYDWEVSKNYKKNSLQKLKQTYKLSFQDFSKGYRSTKGYMENINQRKIFYKKYVEEENKIFLKEYEENINKMYETEFSYHIFKNLIGNFLKFLENEKHIEKFLETWERRMPELYKKYINTYRELEKNKKQKNYENSFDLNLTKNFIQDFNKQLNKFNQASISLNFVRHFKTLKNDESIFYGTFTESEFLESGMVHNEQIQNLEKINIYCSEAKRTLKTAQFYNFEDLIITKDLNEINYGTAENLSFKEYKLKHPINTKMWDIGIDKRFPKGENNQDVLFRVNKLIDLIDNDSIFFTHQVPIRVLVGSFYDIPKKDWFKITIPHNKIIKFKKYKGVLYSDIERPLLEELFVNL